MLTPVLALVVLTLGLWVWMFVTRIPELGWGGAPRKAARPGAQRVAGAYHQLLEHPVIFYAIVFYIVLSGHSDFTTIALAWAYVILMLIHTLIQCTVDVVPARSATLALTGAVLVLMAARVLGALL